MTEVYPSDDGAIRKAKVKTATGYTIRAVSDLYPLELQSEQYLDERRLEENKRLAGPDLKVRLQNMNKHND